MISISHIWHKISAILASTSEEKHLEVNPSIPLDTPEDQGLSDNDKMALKEIWQDEKEGIITFKVEGSDKEFDLSEYDEFQNQIFDHLKNIEG